MEKKMKREDDEDVEDDCDDPAYDPLIHQAARNPKKEKGMARHMNMAAIMGALRSPKTPAGLKKGLLKKYGHMLGKEKMPMSALVTTVKANPKKRLQRKAISSYLKSRYKKQILKYPETASKVSSKQYVEANLDAAYKKHVKAKAKANPNPKMSQLDKQSRRVDKEITKSLKRSGTVIRQTQKKLFNKKKSWYIIYSKTLRIVSGTKKEIQEIFDKDNYAQGVTGPFISKLSAQSYARKES
jgi:hypothetical protein